MNEWYELPFILNFLNSLLQVISDFLVQQIMETIINLIVINMIALNILFALMEGPDFRLVRKVPVLAKKYRIVLTLNNYHHGEYLNSEM